jgi:hypothetical protein
LNLSLKQFVHYSTTVNCSMGFKNNFLYAKE